MLREGNAHYRHNLKALWTHTNLIPEKIKTSPFLKGASSPKAKEIDSQSHCAWRHKGGRALFWADWARLFSDPPVSPLWLSEEHRIVSLAPAELTVKTEFLSSLSLPPSLRHFFSSSSCSLAIPTFFFIFLRIVVFHKDIFLMWTIFQKIFIEFVTILLLFFYACGFFWPRGIWYLSSQIRDPTHTPPALKSKVLTTGLPKKSPHQPF